MKLSARLKSAIYDPVFYQEARDFRFRAALGYFAALIFAVAVVSSIQPIIAIGEWAFSDKKLSALRTDVLALYPDELRLELRNGIVSTNVEEPYFISFPENWQTEGIESSDLPQYFAVINTMKPIATSDFDTYDTAIILSRDSIGYRDTSKGKIEIQSLSDLKDDFVLDEASAGSLLDLGFRFLKIFALLGIILLPLFFFALLMTSSLAFLLIGALIVLGIGKLKHLDLTYGESYKLGLFLMTVPTLYTFIVRELVSKNFDIPFASLIIFSIMTWINLKKRESSPQEDTPAPSAPPVSETPPTDIPLPTPTGDTSSLNPSASPTTTPSSEVK